MVTILAEDGEHEIDDARVDGEDLWVPAADLPAALGWTLKPEGMCREGMCVPLPRGKESDYARDGMVNVTAFWRLTDRVWVRSEPGDLWAFGVDARERADALLSLQAPEVALPDLSGRMHALSQYRGSKVFLVTWASW